MSFQDVEVEGEPAFSGINERTAAPTVLLLLLSHIDHQLDYAEWVTEHLKSNALINKGGQRLKPCELKCLN
jgi:hypothetical protein